MLKRLSILSLIILFYAPLSAQIGVNLNYHQSNYSGWNEVLEDSGIEFPELFRHSYFLGLDYGFGMRQYRVDFYPQLFYKRSVSEYTSAKYQQPGYYQFDLIQYGFQLGVHVYPLDLLSKRGMQCPSFRRGGDVFSKGWFFSFTPGLIYSTKELYGSVVNGQTLEEFTDLENKLIFGFGLGTGIDIGISEYFSLTPMINYTFLLGEKWPGMSERFEQPSFNDGTQVSYLSAGIRIGLWF